MINEGMPSSKVYIIMEGSFEISKLIQVDKNQNPILIEINKM